MSKYNLKEWMKKSTSRKEKFSMRKLSVGFVSVAIGSLLFISQNVSAEEVISDANQDYQAELISSLEDKAEPVDFITPEELKSEEKLDVVQSESAEGQNDELLKEKDTKIEQNDQEKSSEVESNRIDAKENETADNVETTNSEDTIEQDIEKDNNSINSSIREMKEEHTTLDESQEQTDKITIEDKDIYITEEKEIHFEADFTQDISDGDFTFTLGGKSLEEWRKFDKDSADFIGEPWIQVTDLAVTDKKLTGKLTNALPYGVDTTDQRPHPRWSFERLLGNYPFSITHNKSGETKSTNVKVGHYEGFHQFDDLKPALDEIIAESTKKPERLFSYQSLGKSYEGRDLHFLTVAKNEKVIDQYLNETLKKAHENPEVLINALENGELTDYKLPIFINNIHPDESPGVDAQIDLLRRLATEDTILFKSGNELKHVNVDELLDKFFFLFSITMNPDGKYHNTRENSNKMDINRDNAFQTQKETKIMAETVAKYNPLAFLDLHGFVSPMLIEPTTPPHEPNFEYDLLMGDKRDPKTNRLINEDSPGAVNHALAMGNAGISNTKYDKFEIPALDWEDGWDDAGLGYTGVFTMLGGTLGHTIEVPEQNKHSVQAAVYDMLGSFEYLYKHRDALYRNQLEIFKRSLNNEDNRNVDTWITNAKGEEKGRQRNGEENFFPDYYLLPLNEKLQKNPYEVHQMVEYFLRNGAKVYQSTSPIKYKDITYPSGTIVLPLAQIKRGLINAVLATGTDESDWDNMYAELVLNFPALRGFDSIAVRQKELFNKQTLQEITKPLIKEINQKNIETTHAVLKATNTEAVRLVNKLLDEGIPVSIIKKATNTVNAGDYVVKKDDLLAHTSDYFVDYSEQLTDLSVQPLIKPTVYLSPPQDNYSNLTTATKFVLKELGFQLVDNIKDASVIIDASGEITKEEVGNKHYIAIGSRALKNVSKQGIYDLEIFSERSKHEGLLKAHYNKTSTISGVYEENSIAYVASGSALGQPRSEATVLVKASDKDDFFIEGWWPNNEMAKGKILAFSDKIGDQNFTFFATDVTNKAHTTYLYRLLANSLYSMTAMNEVTLPRQLSTVEDTDTFGKEALKYIEYLSKEIGQRPAGTRKEEMTKDYLIDEIKGLGYEPTVMPFEFEHKEEKLQSNNISFVKKGKSTKEIIVGAHYDSVTDGGSRGADDNASGVGVLLELAKRLKSIETDYTIRFVLFGSEEVGLRGSKAYVKQMSKQDKENTLAMVNLDSLIAGDKLYAHAGLNGPHWVKDQVLSITKVLGIKNFQTNPGFNPEYPKGEAGDWSDHSPFNQAGIPVVAFEATNWEIGDKDGYDQTEKYGPIFHTGMDNLDFIRENFPGRIEHHLSAFTSVLYQLLTNIQPPVEEPESDSSQVTPPESGEDFENQDRDKVAQQMEKIEENKQKQTKEGEKLPDTATSTWILAGIGITSLISGLGIKRRQN